MMRLKKLSCHGFKSFADRTEFEFDAPLTGIIGPNGCGKSNVVDALKWCLGDQRARSLRGKEMTDVIFKGAEGRDAMSRAEVSIQLEAGDGEDEDRTEITVGRRLTRDKESEYLLNGDSVRLKDVRDALMNTGLGVGAYSVMEQGRIDAVLSANPEDRRAIFEEAAGISRFKLHKRETLRKLDRTEQNLARVEDLVEERGRRIRSLKVQAQKARRFRKIRDSLRDLKAAVAVIETSEARKEQTDCQQKLAEKTARQKQGEEELARLTAKLGELEDTLREEGTVAEALSSRIHEASGGCDSANARAQAQQERAKDLLADAGDGEDSRQRIIEQKSEKSRSIADARSRMVAMEEELTELGGALVGREDAVRDSVAEIKGLRARCEQLREQALGWIHRKTRLRNAAHDQEAQLRSLDARRARLDQRLAEIEGETTAMESEQQAVDRALTGVREQMATLAVEESKAMALLENADQQAADLTRREAELREKLSSVVGQLEVLLDMESHLEGLDQGPRHIIEQAPSGVTGRLLDLIETDMEHGRALEVALGPFVQALVVDTHVRASELLAHLSAGQHGRALLLVEDAFSEKVTARSSVEIPATAELLADHVRCSSKVRPIVDWLLRGVCLVESLDDVRTGSSDLCFVTREGGLTCGPRTEGGRGEGQAGLFIRKLQIQDLKEREASLRGQLKDLLAGRVEADDRVAALKSEASRLVEAMSELRVQEQQAQGKEDVASQRFLDLKSERQLHQLEVEEIRGLRITCIADLGTCLLNAFLADRFEKQVSANERSVASDLVTAEGVLQSARQAEQEVRLRQVSCARDREGLSAAIRVYEQSMSDLEQVA
ncbi:MAG: AAA family ATPase, partial [Planctomycetota bacterium]|nr:AAA family ATPase [Planctomycetota bacterium]